jgi:hypothetical protein
MARRRRRSSHRRHYSRRNPLTDLELGVGGLVGLAALGLGGYYLYQYFQNQNAAALPPGSTSPGGTTTTTTNAAGQTTAINGYPVVQS